MVGGGNEIKSVALLLERCHNLEVLSSLASPCPEASLLAAPSLLTSPNLPPFSIFGATTVVCWCRVPALNTDKAFIKDMADMVVEALALPTLTVSEVRASEQWMIYVVRVVRVCVLLFFSLQQAQLQFYGVPPEV